MTGTAPEVSVVVCVRNAARTLSRQLQALDHQTGAPAFEVVLVDNGSTDGTAEILAQWRDAAVHAAASVQVVDGGRAPGIPHARNLGAQAARGRVLAFCDADDRVHPGWVAAFARAVGPGVLAGGRILAHGPDGTARPGAFPEGLVGTAYLPHVGNCNCALAREDFLALGGYDESLPAYGFEDVDLSWRAQESGMALRWVPDAVVDFSFSGSGSSLRKKFALGRGRVLMARRYPAYDPRLHTIGSSLQDLGRCLSMLVRESIRARRPQRWWASQCVSAAGRVVGALEYPRGRGAPERRLLA